jgi:hypothetical protein
MSDLREKLEELFYEAFCEDRDAEANADPQTLGQRCKKWAANAESLLAAWLPAHDAKVRDAVLEEYLQHTPAINLQGQITCCSCGETTMGDFAWKKHVRALRGKVQP